MTAGKHSGQPGATVGADPSADWGLWAGLDRMGTSVGPTGMSALGGC